MNLERQIRKRVRGAEHQIVVVAAPRLRAVCRQELARLGYAAEPDTRGWLVLGRLADVYRLNLALRTAARVLVVVAEFGAGATEQLFRRAARVEWAVWLAGDRPLRIDVRVRHSRLRHAGRVADTLRAAIIRSGVAAGAGTPQRLFVDAVRDRCRVLIDSSGRHLGARGYRVAHSGAHLREHLAAGLLFEAGWPQIDAGATPRLFVDAMCGAGTVGIEAALIALGRGAADGRQFDLETWPSFQPALWRHLRVHNARAAVGGGEVGNAVQTAVAGEVGNAVQTAVAGDVTDVVQIAGAAADQLAGGAPEVGIVGGCRGLRVLFWDIDAAAIAIAAANAARAGAGVCCRFAVRDFFASTQADLEPPDIDATAPGAAEAAEPAEAAVGGDEAAAGPVPVAVAPAPVVFLDPPYGRRLRTEPAGALPVGGGTPGGGTPDGRTPGVGTPGSADYWRRLGAHVGTAFGRCDVLICCPSEFLATFQRGLRPIDPQRIAVSAFNHGGLPMVLVRVAAAAGAAAVVVSGAAAGAAAAAAALTADASAGPTPPEVRACEPPADSR